MTSDNSTPAEAVAEQRAPFVLRVGRHRIAPGQPCFVIAEGGVNHEGDESVAHRLVDAAAEAGATAVKFQTFDLELLASADAPRAPYQGAGSQRSMLQRLALSREAHRSLAKHAADRGLLFLSSPFDEGPADFLAELPLPALKIPSGEVTNHPFLAHVSRLGLPLLVSTGMCSMAEVAAAVAVIQAAGDPPLALLHCVSSYPAPMAEANLLAMHTLRAAFGRPTGWSDHTPGFEASLAAVALGASLIEKHLTMDRSLRGPDHATSLEPGEFARLVTSVRAVEAALGDGQKRPQPSEEAIARVARKSLHWAVRLSPGTRIEPSHLLRLRPGTGLAPGVALSLLGRRLAVPVEAGSLVSLAQLENAS